MGMGSQQHALPIFWIAVRLRAIKVASAPKSQYQWIKQMIQTTKQGLLFCFFF